MFMLNVKIKILKKFKKKFEETIYVPKIASIYFAIEKEQQRVLNSSLWKRLVERDYE